MPERVAMTQAFERCESHGGVDAATVEHRRQGCASTEVTGDDSEPVARSFEHLCGAKRAVGVRQPMEPVAADCPALSPRARHRVRRGCGSDGGVERCVETGNRRDVG